MPIILGTMYAGCRAGRVPYGPTGKAIIKLNGVPVEGQITLVEGRNEDGTLGAEVVEVQPDPESAPVSKVKVRVALKGKPAYEILINESDFVNDTRFRPPMQKGLPAGVEFSDELRNWIIARSFAKEACPEYETACYSTSEGMFENGVRLCNKVFTIVGEVRTANNEQGFVVRNSEGKRLTISFQDMLEGRLTGSDVTVYDGLGLGMLLRREWNARSDAEKAAFDAEFLREKNAEDSRKREADLERQRWAPMRQYLSGTAPTRPGS